MSYTRVLLIVLCLTASAFGYVNQVRPFAAIEYDADEAEAIHGAAEAFDPSDPVLFTDGCQLATGNHNIDTLRGYAHLGQAGLTQQQANARIERIQIWGWKDTNGNGEADASDGTTQWTLLHELGPASGTGNVVGYEVSGNPPSPETSTWQGDLLQTVSTLDIDDGEKWLFLVRVIDVSGNSNLAANVGEPEVWWSGDPDGPGSGVDGDQYLDANGSGRIDDDDVVWVTFATGPSIETDEDHIRDPIGLGRGIDSN